MNGHLYYPGSSREGKLILQVGECLRMKKRKFLLQMSVKDCFIDLALAWFGIGGFRDCFNLVWYWWAYRLTCGLTDSFIFVWY